MVPKACLFTILQRKLGLSKWLNQTSASKMQFGCESCYVSKNPTKTPCPESYLAINPRSNSCFPRRPWSSSTPAWSNSSGLCFSCCFGTSELQPLKTIKNPGSLTGGLGFHRNPKTSYALCHTTCETAW